jgi:hypothetical protein
MSTYLLVYRAPRNYSPTQESGTAWAAWHQKLGANLKDRGNPVFKSESLGNSESDLTLGGYSMIRAGSLEEAISLAKGCPFVQEGGGVEVGEVTNRDDQFDAWLQANPGASDSADGYK